MDRLGHVIDTIEKLEKWNGHLFNWYHVNTLQALPNFFISTCDSGNFVACLYTLKGFLLSEELGVRSEELVERVQKLIEETDFSKLYNPELDVFSIGYDYGPRDL